MQDSIMRSGCYNVVATVLLVMNFERTRSLQDFCGICPAGTFCGKSKNQTCIPCPPNSYSSAGGQRACNICTRCEGYHKVKKPCSSTSDAECDCVPGFHCLGAGCAMCGPDCKPGQELTAEGCKECSPGTFNDQEGGVCRPWTNCSLDGKSVRETGTKVSDVACGPAVPDISPGRSAQILTFFLALTSAVAVFLLIFLTLRLSMVRWGRKKFLYIFKQRVTASVFSGTQQQEYGKARHPHLRKHLLNQYKPPKRKMPVVADFQKKKKEAVNCEMKSQEVSELAGEEAREME